MVENKTYDVQVLANKSFYIHAKTEGEAKKKARQRFKKQHGKLEIYANKIW